jgi:hypothetical protein
MSPDDIMKLSKAVNPVQAVSPVALVDSAGNFVEKTGDAINKIGTSDHERLQEANKLEALQQQGATARLKIDTNSDNILSKNVRPLVFSILTGFLIYLIQVYSVKILAIDYTRVGDFTTRETMYYGLIERVFTILIQVFAGLLGGAGMFYFWSRHRIKAIKAKAGIFEPMTPFQEGGLKGLFGSFWGGKK